MRRTLYFKILRGFETWSTSSLRDLFSSRFDEEVGFGYLNTLVEDRVVSSTLLYQSLQYRNVYVPETNVVIREQQALYERVPFQIDADKGLLQTEQGGTRLRKVMSVIGKASSYDVTFDDLDFRLSDLVHRLESMTVPFTIAGMTVTNYRPKPGMSGTFDAVIWEEDLAHEILETYDLDVIKMTIQVILDGSEVTWHLASLGGATFHGEQDVVDRSVDMFKKLVLEGNNA